MTFGDVLDIINPLQHIPIVSTIYRMVTDDEIGVGSRMLGGALFGGPLGVLVSGLTAILEEISGGSVEEHVASAWNALTDEGDAAATIATTEKKDAAPEALVDDEFAAAAPLPAAQVVDAKPVALPSQIPILTNIGLPPAMEPGRLSPQPLASPPVTVSPLTAIHRPRSRQPQLQHGIVDRSAENQRIAKAIEQAQRAQAGLLLANLEADKTEKPIDTADKAPIQQIQPFKSHPYMLPRGAPPQLIGRAMEQALAKYQTTLQQRSGAITAATPRSAPAPIQ
ncbi:MAG: hypothetical protein O3C49_00045 [Proteobacteria bacterium]|nr:hypothetical protein [Pseudomonadota bacterium]MDA1323438.1 hypothetical protein [Pseudomonadota bacterium]